MWERIKKEVEIETCKTASTIWGSTKVLIDYDKTNKKISLTIYQKINNTYSRELVSKKFSINLDRLGSSSEARLEVKTELILTIKKYLIDNYFNV